MFVIYEAVKVLRHQKNSERFLDYTMSMTNEQLKIDKRVGSLEEGKDADFVIWDGPPLSIYSKVQETWIEGTRYWSIDENAQLEERDKTERKDLIQKILSSKTSSYGKEMKPNGQTPQHHHNCLIDDDDLMGM